MNLELWNNIDNYLRQRNQPQEQTQEPALDEIEPINRLANYEPEPEQVEPELSLKEKALKNLYGRY